MLFAQALQDCAASGAAEAEDDEDAEAQGLAPGASAPVAWGRPRPQGRWAARSSRTSALRVRMGPWPGPGAPDPAGIPHCAGQAEFRVHFLFVVFFGGGLARPMRHTARTRPGLARPMRLIGPREARLAPSGGWVPGRGPENQTRPGYLAMDSQRSGYSYSSAAMGGPAPGHLPCESWPAQSGMPDAAAVALAWSSSAKIWMESFDTYDIPHVLSPAKPLDRTPRRPGGDPGRPKADPRPASDLRQV